MRYLSIKKKVTLVGVLSLWQKNLKRKRRKYYVRRINCDRPISGEYETLIAEMQKIDPAYHHEYFRMSHEKFSELLNRVLPFILHKATHRYPISPAARLALTLRTLASGDGLKFTQKSYRMGYSTTVKIFHETCSAIWESLKADYMPMPDCEKWKSIRADFWEKWQFPCCLGAIDGKHVLIQKPPKAGSSFFNFKLQNSIILMAVVDANYCFTYINVGAYGCESDGGVFSRSSFGKDLYDANNPLQLPYESCLPKTEIKVPNVFIADDAFSLGSRLLKPYGGAALSKRQKIHDYHLSRARRTSENGFGIMGSRLRIFRKPINFAPKNVDNIIKAGCVLHNYLRWDKRYAPTNFVDRLDVNGDILLGEWRNDDGVAALADIDFEKSVTKNGTDLREIFSDYFMSPEGSVAWQ